ncbi:UDP-N-acetylglucosamine 2-epimerase (non-hydrolyzing) [Candidatus Chlorohelix sp.]|uniref:non-hydrolyzing UDP-N-acetylglucosamine 2-epimerase n=1 Tax=Candidatus Chlorohelix sp. TaxID=3139201 RepID=UPI0030350AB8
MSSASSTILTFLGTRPEIIKLSPLIPRLTESCKRSVLVHSGQHYSYEMDARFFEELQLPEPDYKIKAGAAGLGAGEQTARMLSGLEPILETEKPALVIVQGDTNTTLAGALAAVKLGIPVLHLEAGCRSFNRTMPEEINRVLIDHIAKLLLAPDTVAMDNLIAEGCDKQASVHIVGSTGLEACLRASKLAEDRKLLAELSVKPSEYFALTLHRAENTSAEVLPGLVKTINALSEMYPVVFPIHPRTEAMLEKYGLELDNRVIRQKPMGYLDMIKLVSCSRATLTDSGGLQEEAAALGVPVLILRKETEWTYLVEAGKATLLGNKYPESYAIARACLKSENLEAMQEARIQIPKNVTEKILGIIKQFLES